MSNSYRAQVGEILEVLAEALAPFVDMHMSEEYPDDDWIVTAATRLGKREPMLTSPSDPQFQLEVMIRWWGPVFGRHLEKETRQTIHDLRQARNDWAHIDETHPIDLEYARAILAQAGSLVMDIGSPELHRIDRLAEGLEWTAARVEARESGGSEAEVMARQLAVLQSDRQQLKAQLEKREEVLKVAAGKQRAVNRQLAEIQAQYAAVAGLQERYEALKSEFDEIRNAADQPNTPDEGLSSEQMATTESALEDLAAESDRLREELARTREEIWQVDPIQTEAGQRWLWLVAALIVVLTVVILTLVMAIRAQNEDQASTPINELRFSTLSIDPSTIS